VANSNPSFICKCIRCREVKGRSADEESTKLVVREYDSSFGDEYFISFESDDFTVIYGFLRLRFSVNAGVEVFPELTNAALIRELHVYGNVVPVTLEKNQEVDAVQHLGFGKRLLRKAEEISSEKGYSRIAVIAGVGVRNYYRKQGYLDCEGFGNFQIKTLDKSEISPIPCVHFPKPLPAQLKLREYVEPGKYEEVMKNLKGTPKKQKFEKIQRVKKEISENFNIADDNPIYDMFALNADSLIDVPTVELMNESQDENIESNNEMQMKKMIKEENKKQKLNEIKQQQIKQKSQLEKLHQHQISEIEKEKSLKQQDEYVTTILPDIFFKYFLVCVILFTAVFMSAL